MNVHDAFDRARSDRRSFATDVDRSPRPDFRDVVMLAQLAEVLVEVPDLVAMRLGRHLLDLPLLVLLHLLVVPLLRGGPVVHDVGAPDAVLLPERQFARGRAVARVFRAAFRARVLLLGLLLLLLPDAADRGEPAAAFQLQAPSHDVVVAAHRAPGRVARKPVGSRVVAIAFGRARADRSRVPGGGSI
eukprot:29101-Pelagococcus_subviridis.AAC.1